MHVPGRLKTFLDPASAVAPRRGPIGIWLCCVAVLVFAMIVIGGLTRLTDSGLSITEWKPVTGAIPPLSDAAWQSEFEKYKQIPEYQQQNRGMSMAEFQFIYWWEWGHRQLGRFLGLAYALPLFAFWALGWFPRGMAGRMVTILALGGAQGAVGWWMVSSGLVDRVDVSHYRLATHLGLAFILFGAVVWTAMDVLSPPQADATVGTPARRTANPTGSLSQTKIWIGLAAALSGVIFIQIIWGALVAGLDAGRIHTDWPLMDGAWVPADYGSVSPWWRDALENRASVQFHHRILGYLIAVLGIALAVAAGIFGALSGPVRSWAFGVAGLIVAQMVLGIITLVNVAPMGLSATHQALAAILFGAALLFTRAVMTHGVTAHPHPVWRPASDRAPAH